MMLGLGLGLTTLRGGGGGPPAPLTGIVLMMVAGQSNARTAGNSAATPPTKYTDGSLGDAYILVKGAGANVFAEIAAGTFPAYNVTTNADPDNSGTAWGSEAEAIYQMRQNGDDRPVYIVKESINGQNLFGQWNPATSGDKFAFLEAKVVRARAIAPEAFTTEVMFWNQGEADSNADADAAAYLANFNAWFVAFRARVSAGAYVSVERIRPMGYAAGNVIDNAAGWLRAWTVREAQIAAALVDGNAGAVSTDFDPTNFNLLHPLEPWTEGKGLRAYAAWQGTYVSTYGAITDTTPNAMIFTDLTDVGASELLSSNAILIGGIERRSAVTITGGEWRTLNSLNADSVVQDWTSSAGFIDPFQKMQLRVTSSATVSTLVSATVTVGGVDATWDVTTANSFSTFEAETTAFVARVSELGGASIAGPQATALNNFFITAKASTWWAKTHSLRSRFNSRVASTINLKDQNTISTQAGLTDMPWTQALGWQPSSSNQARNLQVNPSAVGSQDSGALILWYSQLASGTQTEINDQGAIGILARFQTDGSARMRLHHSAHQNLSGVDATIGLRVISRTASALTTVYGAGASVLATNTVASVARVSTALFMGPANGSGLTSDAALFVTGYADGLTGAEVTSLNGALSTLLTAFA